MIRELGLPMAIDELYFIRKEASNHLAQEKNLLYYEVEYVELIQEIYNRLQCSKVLKPITVGQFIHLFELAEVKAETALQYLNTELITLLGALKGRDYNLYIVSDFYTSSRVLEKILADHDLANLFDAIFVSSEIAKSKFKGNLYPFLLGELKIDPKSAVMIGDNGTSDFKNAQKHGLQAIHVPNKHESKTKKRYLLGSDEKDLRRITRKLYRDCNNGKAPANSDYLLFYAVYIERLYKQAIKMEIQNLFFLSREGLFLKRMFDHYQDQTCLRENDKIQSHYFKTSRQASMLVSLEEVDKEQYPFLRRKYPNLSLTAFLRNFTFSEELICHIVAEMECQGGEDEVIYDFLESDLYRALKANNTFQKAYQKNRIGQQKAFQTYLDSFGVDFEKEGMHLCDIGWGGSIQQGIYKYFQGKVKVCGYYLGLNEVYDIHGNTPRWGLNFSVYPYPTYTDRILRGNTELSEQLLSAGHGSTVSYNHLDSFVNEFHHEGEKKVFDEHIANIQEFMFTKYQKLIRDFGQICYDDDLMQTEMTDYALRVGLFASKRKVANAMKMAEGFYTNVGDFSNGLKISPKKYTKNLSGLIRTFILDPSQLFPLLLRIKPYLYSRKRYFLAYLAPMRLAYSYIKLNRWVKKNWLNNISRFKYDYLR